MFDELKKYKNKDHFFLMPHLKLEDQCNAPTDKSGVFIIHTLAKGKIDMVCIGSSGKKNIDGSINTITTGLGGLKETLVNGRQFGDSRKITFPIRMKLHEIDGLDI